MDHTYVSENIKRVLRSVSCPPGFANPRSPICHQRVTVDDCDLIQMFGRNKASIIIGNESCILYNVLRVEQPADDTGKVIFDIYCSDHSVKVCFYCWLRKTKRMIRHNINWNYLLTLRNTILDLKL